jgi:putative phosphoribosyl transferase
MRGELSEPALVWTGKVMLEGRLAVPHDPVAAVVFASMPALVDETRDAHIVRGLFELQVATVYVPLLTEDEIQFDLRTTHFRHDADLLGQRFIDVAQWVKRSRGLHDVPVGFIGSSGGAAGAIVAAAQRPDLASAVVSIDGRTDLAVDHLRTLRVPILLVVRDMPVLRMNREALTQIRGDRRLEIVHGEVECVVEKTLHWLEENVGRAFAHVGRASARPHAGLKPAPRQ